MINAGNANFLTNVREQRPAASAQTAWGMPWRPVLSRRFENRRQPKIGAWSNDRFGPGRSYISENWTAVWRITAWKREACAQSPASWVFRSLCESPYSDDFCCIVTDCVQYACAAAWYNNMTKQKCPFFARSRSTRFFARGWPMAAFFFNVTMFSGRIFTERIIPKCRNKKQLSTVHNNQTMQTILSKLGYSLFLQQHETAMKTVAF
jgi:hypothetical protein